MIVIFTGLPGSGKSLKLAATLVDILYRNRTAYERQVAVLMKKFKCPREALEEEWKKETPRVAEPRKRLLYTNLQFKQPVEEEFAGYFEYWQDLRQLTSLRDVDVAIDEVATYFDARLWETLSLEMRRWLAQHRKFGIEIYGTSQDFAQVDKAFRRLTSDLLYLTKLIGSRDISATKADPRFIWGLSLVRELDPTVYDEQKSKFANEGLPRFMFITRAATEVFDTRAEVKLSSALPLHHIEKECELPGCAFHKVVHV